MGVKDDVSTSGSNVLLTILSSPRLSRVYKPEEVAELIEALESAAKKAMEYRSSPMPTEEKDPFAPMRKK